MLELVFQSCYLKQRRESKCQRMNIFSLSLQFMGTENLTIVDTERRIATGGMAIERIATETKGDITARKGNLIMAIMAIMAEEANK